MSTEHRNRPPDLDPGNPQPDVTPADAHPRLGGDALLGGAAGAPTSGLVGTGGGLGDAVAQGELMSGTEAERLDPATPAIGTGAGQNGTGGVLARDATRPDEKERE
jgi:hypothetical protein